jgi:hypothetical protein
LKYWPDGQPVFRALGHLKTDEVADVVQVVKIRVLEALERRGVVRVSAEALEARPRSTLSRCARPPNSIAARRAAAVVGAAIYIGSRFRR